MIANKTRTDIDRFMRGFDSVPGPMPEACWVWRTKTGRFKGTRHYADCWAWIHVCRQPFDRYKTIIRKRCNNPLCVRPEHLYAQTRRRMWLDRARAGKFNIPLGSKKGRKVRVANAKLTPELVRMIRSSPVSIRQMARELGIGRSTVQNVRKRLTWRNVPDSPVADIGEKESFPCALTSAESTGAPTTASKAPSLSSG